MIYLLRNLLIIPLLSICGLSYSQDKKINNTTQVWSEIDLLGKISKKFKWQCDFQYSRQSPYENADFVKYAEQLTIRPWIHYYPNPNLKISAFVGFWDNYFIGDNVSQRAYPEYRTALQIQTYKRFPKNMYALRFRTELREIKDRQSKLETVFRERTMFKFQRLLTHSSYDKNSIYLIAQEELFLNDGSVVTGNKFFDQNRIFLGLGYNITDDIAFEAGYFNQTAYHAHDTNFDANHILQVSLVFDNLTKGGKKN